MVKRRPADVPEGQWGSTVVFWSLISKTVTAEDGTEEEDKFFVMKTFTVFNVDQVEGDHLDHLRAGHGETVGEASDAEYEAAQRAIDATEAEIRYGGNQAYYSPAGDCIQLPPASAFIDVPSRLLTTFHELCHWSEHPSRLNWSRKEKENTYGMGELVAELGACYLARELEVPVETAGESAAYLKHWIAAMKGDSSFIFRASSQASKATDFILSFSRTGEAVEEPMAALAC
jgi:antirestriction protein ArdC